MAGRVDSGDTTINAEPVSGMTTGGRPGNNHLWLLLAMIPVVFLLMFYLLPVIEIFRYSFSGGFLGEFLNRDWGLVLRTLGFTFWQALLSTGLTLLIGIPAAYVLYRFDFRGRVAIRTITAIPFILPTVVVAAGINALVGPRGWLNLILQENFQLDSPPIHLVGTLSAILIAHVFYNLTIVIRMVGSTWSGLNPRMDAAAKTLGANPLKVLLRITLPLLNPVIAAAAILVFLFDFTSFGVILLLGGPGFATLEVEVYTQAMALFNLPLASILALIQLTSTIALTVIYQFLSSKSVPLVPADQQKTLIRPTGLRQKIFLSVMLALIMILTLSPMLSLVSRSFVRVDADRAQLGQVSTGLTLANYQALVNNPRQDYFYIPPIRAIWNSFKFAILTAVLSVTLGLMSVYGFQRIRHSKKILDVLLMIPLGTSAVTLGLGYVIFFNKPPFLWGSSQWLIPMAHTLVALPFVVRGLSPALAAIPNSYRQSAAVLGASPREVIMKIDLPLIRTTLLSSFVFAFTISLGEFGATTFLSRPDYPTIPIAIYRFLSQPGGINYGQAMAMSTILMLVCAAGIVFIEKTIFTIPEKG